MPLSVEQIATKATKRLLLEQHLRVGDLVSFTRCLGVLSEVTFLRWQISPTGGFLIGRATRESLRYRTEVSQIVDDITVWAVTHVNRVPVGMLTLLPYTKGE